MVWALQQWLAGRSVFQMRADIDKTCQWMHDRYTGVSILNNEPWIAELIARRLRVRNWQTAIEYAEGSGQRAGRIIVADKQGIDKNKFVIHFSSKTLFALRYLLHAVLSTPPDVFPMVHKAFSAVTE